MAKPPNPNRETIARVFHDYINQPRWVAWEIRHEQKVPLIGASKKAANINDPATWRPLAQCPSERVGIVFNGDGLGGVDLDGCRFADGALTEWATDWIKRCDSYTEISPSGAGVKIFLRDCPPSLPFHQLPPPGE